MSFSFAMYQLRTLSFIHIKERLRRQDVNFKFAKQLLLGSQKDVYLTCSAGRHGTSMTNLKTPPESSVEQEKNRDEDRIVTHFQEIKPVACHDSVHQRHVELGSGSNSEPQSAGDELFSGNLSEKEGITVRSTKRKSTPHYPLLNMGDKEKTFTSDFRESEKFLESLNLPTCELPYYPDVQNMSKEEIYLSVERLKEIGIRVVFNLYLIRRMSSELMLEKTAVRAPLPHTKNSVRLRNGKYRLTSLQVVALYLELCRLLEQPDLNLYAFMDSLAIINVYDHFYTVVSKMRQLRSLGAKPQDILSNLALLRGCKLFKSKVQLYENLFRYNKLAFSVNLFLSSTMNEFKKKLQVGQDVSAIAKLLEVSPVDFLLCWGFRPRNTSNMMCKIHMCLKAGISKQDIFNNITLINRLCLDKSQAVIESLLNLGHPVSLCELRALEDTADYKYGDAFENQTDWTSGDSPVVKETSPPAKSVLRKKKSTQAERKRYFETSKIWRMEVFKLITHLLSLSPEARRSMFKANISVDSTQIQDITQNLEYLTSNLKFTKEQISACPLILVHPHSKLCFVTREVESLLEQHFARSTDTPSPAYVPSSPTSPSTDDAENNASPPTNTLQPSSSSSSSSSSLPLSLMGDLGPSSNKQIKIERSFPKKYSVSEREVYRRSEFSSLLTEPLTHLNVLQYFLEKDVGFSLSAADTIVLRD